MDNEYICTGCKDCPFLYIYTNRYDDGHGRWDEWDNWLCKRELDEEEDKGYREIDSSVRYGESAYPVWCKLAEDDASGIVVRLEKEIVK